MLSWLCVGHYVNITASVGRASEDVLPSLAAISPAKLDFSLQSGRDVVLVLLAITATGQAARPHILSVETAPDARLVGDRAAVMTEDELERYNGSDPSLPILLAVGGIVFDVTSGNDFYAPGKSYTVFAGRACTRR